MPTRKKNVLFDEVLQDLLLWFKSSGADCLIIGGIAVSLLARPRTTQDIDVLTLLDESKWEDFLQAGRKFGFEVRLKDALRFAQENRILLLRHGKSGVNIDISFGFLPFEEESIKRKVIHKIGSLHIPLPTPEDLVIMKMVAHRPQDMIDIKTIIEAFPKLDRQRVQNWVKEFAQVMDNPEMLADLKKILSVRRRS